MKNITRILTLRSDDEAELVEDINHYLKQKGYYKLHGKLHVIKNSKGYYLIQQLIFKGPLDIYENEPQFDEDDANYYPLCDDAIAERKLRRKEYYVGSGKEMTPPKNAKVKFLLDHSIYHVESGRWDELRLRPLMTDNPPGDEDNATIIETDPLLSLLQLRKNFNQNN